MGLAKIPHSLGRQNMDPGEKASLDYRHRLRKKAAEFYNVAIYINPNAASIDSMVSSM